MTLPYGLGALQSPPDDRDFELELDTSKPLPVSYRVPDAGVPIYNQGSTPQCVSYSAAGEQQSFDLSDLGHTYVWDFAYFFRLIGGGPNGAVIRNAFDWRLHRGYPLKPSGSGNSQSSHKIAAYYSVPKNRDSIKRALLSYGRLVMGIPWMNSWFDPHSDGSLPAADYIVGGHAIDINEYDATGIWLPNSWGLAYGINGRVHMSWSQVEHSAWEIWKATDVITGKP